jgi:hypothetical protein
MESGNKGQHSGIKEDVPFEKEVERSATGVAGQMRLLLRRYRFLRLPMFQAGEDIHEVFDLQTSFSRPGNNVTNASQ